METQSSYTPRKRRAARARALPDAGVAVSACGLAVWSFTLLINNMESEIFGTEAGVLQESFLSLIFFLFYNKEFIQIYNQPSLKIYSL
jgi:hypothetical protein